jgi:ubiquinone biosynthesis protein UbiJ
MDQELVQYLDGRFNEVNDRIDEVKRHSGVLVEGLRHEVHLVAEALTMHIQVQHVQEREYFDRKFEDTHALIHSSYDHLHRRVEHLERNRPS